MDIGIEAIHHLRTPFGVAKAHALQRNVQAVRGVWIRMHRRDRCVAVTGSHQPGAGLLQRLQRLLCGKAGSLVMPDG
ncbi:hypothetical protein D3C72_2017960 [compost metagenome]